MIYAIIAVYILGMVQASTLVKAYERVYQEEVSGATHWAVVISWPIVSVILLVK